MAKKAKGMSTEFVKKQVGQYLKDTFDSRRLCERDRDYFDHKQWTEQEIAILNARKQAPVVVNRIKPKVEGLIGLYNLRRVDPKAYPRTQKHEKAAHVVTDGLRYVADNNDFDRIKSDCAEDFWIEGTCGAIVDVKPKKNGEPEIRIRKLPWDRLYWDTHSREKDFSDARFMGFMQWVDEDQLKEMYPKVNFDDIFVSSLDTEADDTFEDRPRWQDSESRRLRLSFHFYIYKGIWHFCVFSGDDFLVNPMVSPFDDDEGEPTNPMVLVSANIDRDNQRYGEVRGYIDNQNEINHRRSKALHTLSNRQTFGRQGSVKDVGALKREMAKPDGHIQFQGEEFGKDFGILPTGDMAQGQFLLYQDAKGELDAIGFNAQLSGERQSGDLSGKAIDRLQQAGTIELNRQYSLLNGWEKRIYREIWARIKQFWNEEKWIRITDDQDNLRWVGLNSQVTAKEWMEEQMEDESRPLDERRQIAASYQFLMQAAQQNPEAAAKLEEIVEVKNDVAELDVDILLDQTFDVVNIQAEQFTELAKLAQTGMIDVKHLLKLSSIRGKEEIIAEIQAAENAQAQAGQMAQQVEMQEKQVDMGAKYAKAKLDEVKAQQVQVETMSLINAPDEDPQVSV